MILTAAKKRALDAVASGLVRCVHPFRWILSDAEDTPEIRASTLNAMLRDRWISIDTKSPEYERPVLLTEAGQRARETGEVPSTAAPQAEPPRDPMVRIADALERIAAALERRQAAKESGK